MPRKPVLLVAFVCAWVLTACVHAPAPSYQPGVASTLALRTGSTSQLGVGEFTADAKAENENLGMRGSGMTGASADGRFSTYLQQALVEELRNAGRYEAASTVRITGALLDNQLDASGSSRGMATIKAQFVVTRGGEIVYDKALRANHTWESSFIGTIAIPMAMENYAATVQELLTQLFTDPQFVEATR